MLLSCSQPPPTPAPLAADAGTDGAMVRFDGVQGYLARPERVDREQYAEVWQTDATPEVQHQARVRAAAGVRVFVVPASDTVERTRAYLNGLEPKPLPLTVCTGPCPETPKPPPQASPASLSP